MKSKVLTAMPAKLLPGMIVKVKGHLNLCSLTSLPKGVTLSAG